MTSLPGFSAAAGTRRSLCRFVIALLCAALAACGGGGDSSRSAAASLLSGDDAGSRLLNEMGAQQALFVIAGSSGGPGDLDGKGASARFNLPQGIAAAADGSLYVADSGNHVVRRIAPDATVSTVAGKSGEPGSVDGSALEARFAGLRYIAADGAGNLYVTDRNSIRKIGADGRVSTLAGQADSAGSADGSGAEARFSRPAGIAVDAAGNVYVADQDNHTIRRISAAGAVATLAGAAGIAGNADGAGATARFNAPQGIALGTDGNLYVADRDNFTIRRVTADGIVNTVAGSPGISGSSDGAGTAAQFFAPQDVAADAEGNLYVVDAFLFPRMCLCGANGLVRRIARDGTVSTLAGTSKAFGSTDGAGPAARFDYPLGIAHAPDGNLYVADTGNSTVRRITRSGEVTTFAGAASVAGSVDGDGTTALFVNPIGIAAGAGGSLYIADAVATPDEANAVIRKWNAGRVETYAGIAGVTGAGYADGAAAQARFSYPQSVTSDRAGNVYVADTGNGVIRKITPAGAVSTLAGQARSFGSVDGAGSAARFQGPAAIASDAVGNLYVTDILHGADGSDSATIRRVSSSGVVTTLAGTAGAGGDADGQGPAARFTLPLGIAVGVDGAVYATDAARHTVRRIAADGTVSTVAGSGGNAGDADGAGAAARFHAPQGIALDSRGNAYVADTLNGLVRRIAADGQVSTVAGTRGLEGIAPGPLPGVLYRPQGIALVDDGLLAVTSGRSIVGLKLQ